MEELCAYGMRSRIWKESKFGTFGYVKFISSICVSPGFGGLTGGAPAVRPAAHRRSDRRHLGGSTGGHTAVRPVATGVSNRHFRRFDRSIYIGQTDVHQAVRPAQLLRKVSHPYVIPEAINTDALKTEFENNCKARNILLSGISRSEYDRVAHLETAHEIWNALRNFHQGTNNIKELRRDLFKKEYIKFEMKSGKALDNYLSRFNKILSDLRSVDSSYDVNYPQSEISRHFLNGLDMSIWEMKVTSIEESVNMSTLTLDSLYTKLKTHEMNILSRKVDSKSSVLVSSSSSLIVDASSSMPSFLAAFNATSDYQLEQIEEEDLALVANRIARAMNNVRNRKRGGPNRCFECGSIDYLRSHCPKLGRGKREDKDGEKTNNNKPNNYKSKGSNQGKKMENHRKAFQQVCAAFEPLSDVDGESGDDDKGKNVSDVCFMVRGESDTEYEDNEVSILKNSLLRFSDGKKNLNMILDQSKVLVLEVALVARKENVWIVDSGCSRHMTGDKNWFSSLKKASKTESIVFADASTSAVVATGLNVALVKDLKYNLLSVSQIVDENFEVHFKKTGSKVFDSCGDSVLNISRYGRVFKADFENSVSPVITCLVAKFDKAVMFWHRRLGHVGFDHLTRLSGLDLVRGLPKLKKDFDLVCTPCRHAKMISTSHAPIVSVMMDAPGQLLHMDTVGPARVQSVGGKWYVLVIVEDFSRYSWVFFMATKDEAFQHFRGLFLRLELEFPGSLKRIRSDNGGEFKNASFEQFCNERGLEHEFSSPCVHQQNGVVERKNRVLVEMARTMLDEYKTPRKFWAEAINTACYISNRVFLRSKLGKTSYELRFGHQPKVSHLRVFGCKCFVLKSGNLDKFEARSTDGLFLGYPAHTRGYRVLILGTNKIVGTCEVSFDEASPGTRLDIAGTLSQVQGEDGRIFEDESDYDDDDEVGSAGQTGRQASQIAGTPPVRPAHEERSDRPGSSGSGTVDADRDGPPENSTSTSTETERGSTSEVAAPLHIQRRHLPEQIIGNIGERTTRSKVMTHDVCANSAFVASFEPKDVSHALTDESWINAMHEELENFKRNKVWTLVAPPSGHNVIGTKWVFKNKQNEDGLIVRNKARLIAQGFTQVEGLGFHETFALVARIEAIRLLLAFAASKGFNLYQMDVKSVFLNGFIQEEVYVKQPPGFENPDFPNHVFKLSKALYGLKLAPRAWYDRLKNFLLAKGFTMGKVDKTLFVLKHDFAETMRREFEMSMMGELSYFLELQIKQTPQAVLDPDEDGEAVDQKEYRSMNGSLLYLTASRPDIQFAVCLCARFQASPRASHRQAVKRIMRYLNHTLEFGIWYSTSSSICLSGYSDADFGGCRIDRKSTSGTCHFLGTSLIAWSSRKQSSVAQSTAESEYVAAASCCSQILWLLSTLKDYGLTFEKVPLFCDNTSAINIAKNPVQHSRTKHIDIRFHFLRDHVEKGDVEL
uniref:Retrotransposon protein, putative, unclassified n=1 Tax=Oryza sativa subsp. japonica TaxID=39947 RepID=Q33AL4_ORYSJ|nr:retrotransposon protein, putative, unclassified [Oryza sativa Japonica Group]